MRPKDGNPAPNSSAILILTSYIFYQTSSHIASEMASPSWKAALQPRPKGGESAPVQDIALQPGVSRPEDRDGAGDLDDYPEGGLQAWLVVLGAWCAMVPPMGILNTIAVLQGWFSQHDLQGVPESQTGWIFSCYAFFITAAGAQVGMTVPPRLCVAGHGPLLTD